MRGIKLLYLHSLQLKSNDQKYMEGGLEGGIKGARSEGLEGGPAISLAAPACKYKNMSVSITGHPGE